MMNKFIEIAKARAKRSNQDSRMTAVLMKTLESIACERAGKTPLHDDAKIYAELLAVKTEQRETAKALTDEAALIAVELFEEWKPDVTYEAGDRILYNGNLYRCKAPNPINPTWTPDVVHEYYEPVAKPAEAGTLESPITAVAGMTYEVGKYYAEGDKVYLCIRDGMSAGEKITLQHLPSALIGHYFVTV